jgi:hypothetical protein
MPEIDVDLSDVGDHITGLEAVLLQIFHLKKNTVNRFFIITKLCV